MEKEISDLINSSQSEMYSAGSDAQTKLTLLTIAVQQAENHHTVNDILDGAKKMYDWLRQMEQLDRLR